MLALCCPTASKKPADAGFLCLLGSDSFI